MSNPNYFGGPIDQAKADELYNRFYAIKERSLPKIQVALAGDDEAFRYYCGRLGNSFPLGEDLAYYFNKDSMTRIMKLMTDSDAHGIVILHGARSKEDSRDETGNYHGESDGRPTVMLFPYKVVEREYTDAAPGTIVEVAVTHILDKGEEHPGTGGDSDPGNGEPVAPRTFRIPVRLDAHPLRAGELSNKS